MSIPLAAFNGNPGQDLLDRVLAGQPADVKARVLELVVRLGIDPRDELFLIMIALGQLQCLIEDSPNDWQTLFDTFQEELSQWTDTHLETLETLARKAQTEEMLSNTCTELVSSLTRLTTTCNELIARLPTSLLSSTSSASSSTGLNRDSEILRQMSNIEDTLRRSHQHLSKQLNQSGNAKGSVKRWLILQFLANLGALIAAWFW